MKNKTDNFLIISQFHPPLSEECRYYLINWNNIKIIFPVIITKINHFLLKIKVIQCFTDPVVIHGVLPESELHKAITEFLNYLTIGHRLEIISVTQWPTLKPDSFPPKFKNWELSLRYSLIIDLSQENEKLFYNLEKRTRYVLRKATKLDDKELISSKLINIFQSSIKISSDYRDLKYFYKDWSDLKEKIIKEGLMPSNALEKSVLDKSFKYLSEVGFVKLFLIFDGNGKIGASAIIFTIKDFLIHPTAYYSAGTSSEIGRKLGLPTVLQWFIINWLKYSGFRFYDLGGYIPDPNHGPSQFKKGFGGVLIKGWTLTSQPLLIKYLNSILTLIRIKKQQFLMKFKDFHKN